MSSTSVVYSSTPGLNPSPITGWQTSFSGTISSLMPSTTASFGSLNANVSTSTWTLVRPVNPHAQVKKGKYRVRCRGCARWAKVLRGYGSGLVVNCDRCLGEKPGFLA